MVRDSRTGVRREGCRLGCRWVGVLAALGIASGAASAPAGRTSPATVVVDTYVDVVKSPGPSPAAWPEDHDSQQNNPVAEDAAGISGPNYLVSLPALANSVPIMAGGRLYVAGGYVTGSRRQAHPGYVWAINPSDGAIEWSVDAPNSVFAQPIVANNVLLVGIGNAAFLNPSASPATTPGSIRGVGPSGLDAYNAQTGASLWKFPTPGADQAPPTVMGNTVYLVSGDRQFYAINLATGKEEWAVNIGHYVSRSSPRIVGDKAYMGGAGPLGVVAVNLDTHRVVWQRPIPGALQGVDDTPIAVAPSRLVSAAMLGTEGVAPTSRAHQAEVYAINPKTGAIVWSTIVARGPAPSFKATGTPTVVGDRVYVGNAINGRVVALSLKTGKVIWAYQTGSPVTRPPAVLNGRVYVLTKSGILIALSTKGKLIAAKHVADWVNTYGPVIYNGSVAMSGNTAHQGYLAMIPLLGQQAKV